MPTRSALIHKAASLPKGSPERKDLLRKLQATGPGAVYPDIDRIVRRTRTLNTFDIHLVTRVEDPADRNDAGRDIKAALERIAKALPEIGLTFSTAGPTYSWNVPMSAGTRPGPTGPAMAHGTWRAVPAPLDERTIEDLIDRIL